MRMPSKRVRKGKTHWVGQVSRRNFRREKLFKTKTEATQWESEVKTLLRGSIPEEDIKRLLDEGLSPKAVSDVWEREQTPTVSLHEWATAYLDHVRENVSAKTYKDKLRILRRFLNWHGKPGQPVQGLSTATAHRFLMSYARSKSHNTANVYRTHLGAAWNWAMKYQMCPAPNPFQVVDKFSHEKSHHYMPPMEDFLKVVDLSEGQDKALLWTYYYTGARRKELFNLIWEDIDLERGRLRLYTRKRRGGLKEADWVGMTEALIGVLREQHERTGRSEWVFLNRYGKPFRSLSKFLGRLCEEAGVKPFGFHGIRALTATSLARENTPMVVIQQHLRHRSLQVTEDYIRGVPTTKPYLDVLDGGLSKRTKAA
ncbi:integrase [Desulfoferula mesophila]|uniref:Integrase n=2 Tax=Desulfoferula mesophila TaxID=3058419 RepID=A0AAU9EM78_9BACT|nr:integrase [Desulfoferula mesophilus]